MIVTDWQENPTLGKHNSKEQGSDAAQLEVCVLSLHYAPGSSPTMAGLGVVVCVCDPSRQGQGDCLVLPNLIQTSVSWEEGTSFQVLSLSDRAVGIFLIPN